MKKRLLATICALALVAGMSMTAVAAPSPALNELIAANIDLDITSEEADIKVADVSKPMAEDKPAPARLKVAVLEAVQNSIVEQIRATKGEEAVEDFRFLGLIMVNGKKPSVTEDYTVKFDAKAVKATDNVKVFAYNTVTKVWDQLLANTEEAAVNVLSNNVYSAMFFIVDEDVPLASNNKGEITSIEMSSDIYQAPMTGEADVVMYFAFAAIAFAGIFAVSGKKLFA